MQNCESGEHGVPASLGASGALTSVSWAVTNASAGMITATGNTDNFPTSNIYTLTAAGANGKITWTASGSCTTGGLC